MKIKIVVPWHNSQQIAAFRSAWSIGPDDARVILQRDGLREGCARTKNKGVRAALEQGAEVIIVLDDDCYPSAGETLDSFVAAHLAALEPQPVEMFEQITAPASRGTPYFNRTLTIPVAASIGFWNGVGDYDGPGQLVHGARTPMAFNQKTIFGKYFAFSGMNFAFRSEWAQAVQFVDLARWDDIFMGYVFQRLAYDRGYCFNLNGPLVEHSRQSNVWQNLRDESLYMEANETLWQRIALARPELDELRALLPRCPLTVR